MRPNTTSRSPVNLSYWDIIIAVLIVLLAVTIRFVSIDERAQYDDKYGYNSTSGVDPQTYLEQTYGLLNGTWPTEPYFYHPLSPYIYAGIMRILGDSMEMLYLGLCVLDGFTCGFLIIGGWILARKNWVGWLAGILYAIYPVAIFYTSAIRPASLAALWIVMLVVLILWQRESFSIWRTICLGFFAGLLMLTRINLIPLVAGYGLWLLLLNISWKDRIIHSILYALIAIVVVAPFTLHNYQASGGKFIPIATTGSREIYWANHRDSVTLPARQTPASQAINYPYLEALWIDVQVAPQQFIGLLTYKAAMFWRDVEFFAESSRSFERAQIRVPILNITPLSYNYFSFFALIGLFALWQKDRKAAILFSSMIAWIWISYTFTFAISRIRYPIIGLLVMLSAYALYYIVNDFIPNFRLSWRKHTILIALISSLLIGAYWLTYPIPKIPFKRTYQELPPDAIALNIPFGDEIVLRGWRPFRSDIWPASAEGWVSINETYMIELFWELQKPTDIEYKFYLAYIDNDTRYSALDTSIGAVSFPHIPTNLWDEKWGSNIPMQGEIVGIRLDKPVPTMQSGQIEVGVWYFDDEGRIQNVYINEKENAVTLQTLAVVPATLPDVPKNLSSKNIIFGEQIALRALMIPQNVQAGENISLTFYWEASDNVQGIYRQFLHLEDIDGNLVAQVDKPPLDELLTPNWPESYPLIGTIQMAMPSTPNTYYLYTGLYNEAGRLSVDAPDDRLYLGEIQVLAKK